MEHRDSASSLNVSLSYLKYDKMDFVYKSFVPLLEDMYRFFTWKKTCSVQLQQDYFDNQVYSIEEFYNNVQVFFNQPGLFYTTFQTPSENDIIEVIKSENNHRVFVYPSPVQTQWIENNKACFKLFSKKPRSKTILLFAPGWARPHLNAETKICHQLLKNGIDTCLLVKPFHQERTPQHLYSGELFISGNIFLTVMNFRQFVSEIRFLLNYFKKQYEYIGIIGMSSGGIQAALAIDVEPVDFYFPIITGAKLGSITWNSKLTNYIKKDVIKKGINEEQLNKAWAIADQYFLGHNCKAKYIKQFISLYDEAVPTKYQYLLKEIYNNPEVVEMKCAHTSVFFYFNKIADEIIKAVYKKI